MARTLHFVAAVALLTSTACIHVYQPQPQSGGGAAPAAGAARPAGAPAAADASKGPFKPWEEVLKDTRAVDGYFKTHLKRDQTLFFEVRPEQLEKDFGMLLHISRGTGVYNLHAGLSISDMMLMRFERVGDKLYLVHRNTRFTAAPNSPMKVSTEENVGHSILAAFKIESENKDSKALLIDVTPFFTSDYPGGSEALKWYHGQKPIMHDQARSYVGKVMGFPKNVEIDALLTYRANDYPTFSSGAGVSDFRSIPVGIRYSIVQLPEQPMRRRFGDDRVGYFMDAQRDFSRDQEPSTFVRYVNRWRLEKKDPNARVSEPVQQVVYYVDKSVPLQYRKYVKEGIEAWNKAFEEAGFKNAIVAKDAPTDDPNWNAEDVRYSTVKWTASHEIGYAIGPSQTDPRTGEILNADILIGWSFVQGWTNEYQELVGAEGLITKFQEAERLRQTLPAHMASRMCLAELGMAHQLGVQHALLAGMGIIDGTGALPEEFLGQALRELVMHEVGHTLGLRHNFKSSAGVPYEKLNDREFTKKNGLTVSVMDYAPVNVALDQKQQGFYYTPEVGSYDVWAIKYGYAPVYEQTREAPFAYSGKLAETPEAELVGLRKIASLGSDPLHSYNTDEDTHLGPMGVDPVSNTWDLGSDPMRFARDRAQLVNKIMPKIEQRMVKDGEGYQRLRNALNGLLFERFFTLMPVTKYVGGLYFARDHIGDSNARLPFTPVSAEKQREIVRFIAEQAFAEDAIKIDPALLNKLPPSRWADWSGWGTPNIDYPLHETVGALQGMMLWQLLHNGRLARMVNNSARGDSYTVAELFTTLTGTIWSELGDAPRAPRQINSFRRNLQRMYIDEMSAKVLNVRMTNPMNPAPPEDARSLARHELSRTSQRIGQALAAGGNMDVTTRAHLEESKARIDKALESSLTVQAR